MNNKFIAMSRCFFCGEGNEILIHKRFRDISEVHNKVISMRSCPTCEGYMKQGVILISCRPAKSDEERKNPYRTGGFWVIKEEPAKKIFGEDSDALKHRVAFIENEVCVKIGLPNSEQLPT